MGELIFVGLVSAVSVGISLMNSRTWKKAARATGLEFSSRFVAGRKLEGVRRGFEVVVKERSDREEHAVIAEVHGVDPGFTLGKDNAFLRMIKPDIETGDRVFDERIRIEGDEDLALAVLGDRARRLTEIVVTGADGELKNHTIRAPVSRIENVASTLNSMIDLAEVLRRPDVKEVPGLLARRAREDDSSGVRLQAFRRLTSAFPRSEEVRATAEQLLSAPAAAVRLEAARVLIFGDRGLAERGAEALADLAVSPVDTAIRREAVEILAGSEFGRIALPTMVSLLDPATSGPPAVRRAALDGLVRTGAKDELLAVEPADAAEAETLAQGLGLLDLSAQPRLLQFLEHSEDRVRLEAARSLGRIGDLDAVAALRDVAGTGSLFRSAVARTAEHAISEIKNRVGGTQAGEISMVSPAPLEGAVSPADAGEGGEVSLV